MTWKLLHGRNLESEPSPGGKRLDHSLLGCKSRREAPEVELAVAAAVCNFRFTIDPSQVPLAVRLHAFGDRVGGDQIDADADAHAVTLFPTPRRIVLRDGRYPEGQ